MSDNLIEVKWMSNHEAVGNIYQGQGLFHELMDLSLRVGRVLSNEEVETSVLLRLLGQLTLNKHTVYLYTLFCDPASYHNMFHNRSREAHPDSTEWREVLSGFRDEIASKRDILEEKEMNYWLDFAKSHDTALEIMGGGSDLHIENILFDFTYMWLNKWSDEESIRLENLLVSILNTRHDKGNG